MTPEVFRKNYLLLVALAGSAREKGDIKEACDLAETAFREAIAAAYEAAAKEADYFAANSLTAKNIAKNIRARIKDEAR